MEQGGSSSATVGNFSIIRVARRQSCPSKCWQAFVAQGAAVRKISAGVIGLAFAMSSSVAAGAV